MPAIHFVERLGNTHKVSDAQHPHEYDCGYWVVAVSTAERLVAEQADLYLHDGQAAPSRFGGTILGFRVHQGGPENGRIVFRIQATPAHRGVTTGREGWGNEKKIVW
ncbi:hypothetical protein [Variovorax sp. Varisp62]|uniref:hypothetical protein n=1 Tax=Variovorax sp. Varisp62 TaxID=3243049 RepID=UPI0039B470C1